MAKYTPISCLFHDQLEHLATAREECVITFWDTNNIKRLITGKIGDLLTIQGEEYLKIDNGLQIRLDYLICVNGSFLEDYNPTTSCIRGPNK